MRFGRQVLVSILFILSTTPLAGCLNNTAGDGLQSEQKDSSEAVQRFAADPRAVAIVAKEEGFEFSLARSSLGNRYIWTAWIEKSDGSIYPTFEPGNPTTAKVVRFVLSPDQNSILMIDGIEKRDPLSDAPDLLDRFPVKDLSDDRIVFDFASGLRKRELSALWTPDVRVLFPIDYSYTYKFKSEEGLVTFSELQLVADEKRSTFVLRHAFRLMPDEVSFPALRVSDPLHVGVFPADMASAASAPTSNLVVRRFDPRKKIQWKISASTPVEYREDIRAGILWWNRAFGDDFIEADVLSEPIEWSDARTNLLQWSDDGRACGDSMAFGPSEANPITGEIYLGKVLFCGRKFEDFFDMSDLPARGVDKSHFMHHLYRWAAAHEVGHAIGLAHNFMGKHFRDQDAPNLVTSTVMDYPSSQDILAIDAVGPRDIPLVQFLYGRGDSDASLKRVGSFPSCTDDEVAAIPLCEHFIPGNISDDALIASYLQKLSTQRNSMPRFDHYAARVVVKAFLTRADDALVPSMESLMRLLPTDVQATLRLAKLVRDLTTANRLIFSTLPEDYQHAALSLLAKIVDSLLGYPANARIEIAEAVAAARTPLAFDLLHQTANLIRQRLDSRQSPTLRRDDEVVLYFLDRTLDEFWKTDSNWNSQASSRTRR